MNLLRGSKSGHSTNKLCYGSTVRFLKSYYLRMSKMIDDQSPVDQSVSCNNAVDRDDRMEWTDSSTMVSTKGTYDINPLCEYFNKINIWSDRFSEWY